jgi:hypothetical protein
VPPEFIADPSSRLSELKKDLRPYVQQLIDAGWRFRDQGHKWRAYCWCKEPTHQMVVNGTPGSPKNHGRQLVRRATTWHPEA